MGVKLLGSLGFGLLCRNQTNNIFLSYNCVIFSTNKGGQMYFSVMCHGPNKAFLVPDSCRATERKGNSVSADVTDDTIEND